MFRVTVEEEASTNLRDLFLNLQEQYPGSDYSLEWYYGIRAVLRDLATSANQCGPAYEDRFFSEHIRQRLHGSHKVLFTIRNDVVHILHIRHQSQNPDELK